MRSLYNILTHFANYNLQIIGKFNHKLDLGVKGRRETFDILKNGLSSSDKTIWFHCASLGEYEQGLPVFEEIKKVFPTHKIVLSFFSPSGYEIRKNAPIADCVVYLPLDTPQNAKKFLDLINPELVVFVKYEIWPNYLRALQKRKIHAILISALFKKEQVFFKPHGAWMRKYLAAFQHIFVQNKASKELLNRYRFTNVTISGDTRFDRVSNQLKTDNSLPFINEFKNGSLCIVAGSTWPDGEKILAEYINKTTHKDVKFIIAPHNIKPKQIEQLRSSIQKKVVLHSNKSDKALAQFDVFIIDTIGILSKIYSYADIAYVGGAIGNTGLHNTLEAAVFGIPIITGHQIDNFPEASEMKKIGGLFTVSNQDAFDSILDKLISNTSYRMQSGGHNGSFVFENKGGVSKVMAYLSS